MCISDPLVACTGFLGCHMNPHRVIRPLSNNRLPHDTVLNTSPGKGRDSMTCNPAVQELLRPKGMPSKQHWGRPALRAGHAPGPLPLIVCYLGCAMSPMRMPKASTAATTATSRFVMDGMFELTPDPATG